MTSPTPPTVAVPPSSTTPYEQSQQEIRLEEEDVRYLIALVEETVRDVGGSIPRQVEGDLFGGGHLPERMARHTLGAHERILRTLLSSVQALEEHAGSLQSYRDELNRVEDTIQGYLDQINGRVATIDGAV
ncbi:hypothetical protein [Nocardioides dongxiaopingii]|uniref:hypothetical protein n=1 Tax=Nocardioides dongxiaopingii TaxID=2576036 RepID=UPI0010C767C0|nr:hypothetical protein [Nocardioides dongxiaopingii]